MPQPSTLDYVVLEARFAPRRAPVAMALAGIASVAGSHAIVPRMPERVISFMEQGFRVEGMGAVLLLSDLMSVYFFAFFVGAAGLLRVAVEARERHVLELLLAKPVRASAFLAARSIPALGAAVVVGAVTASACAFAARGASGPQVAASGALGAGLFVTAFVLVELAVLDVAFVRARDSFQALLVACFVWLAPLVPTATLLYRPDVLDRHASLVDTTLLPSLIWHEATMRWLGPVALAIAVLLCVPLLRVGGRLLERSS